MALTIQSDTNVVTLVASYTPYDTLDELVECLHALLTTGDARRTVRVMEEPEVCELRFEHENGTISLEVCRRFSHQHRRCHTLFEARGSVLEMCLPFWRALRSLQTRFPEKDFELRWQRPFPASGMERLSAHLKSLRTQ
jgi:hypothetical protein